MNRETNQEQPPPARLSPGQSFLRIVVIAVAYFLAHRLAFLFPDAERVLMAVWPVGGIGLAALLLNPPRLWPAIVLSFYVAGVSADMLLAGRSFFAGVGYMTGNVVESLGCAGLIVLWGGRNVRFARVRDVLALTAGAVFVNALSSFIGAGAAHFVHGAEFWDFWRSWYVADGLGLLLITPLIVTWADFRDAWRGVRWDRTAEAAAFMALWCATGWLLFRPSMNLGVVSPQPYMLVALLAWAALRLGQRGVTMALVVLAGMAITSKAVTVGPLLWGGETVTERLLGVQVYLGFTAVAGFLLAASRAETQTTEDTLQRSRELLRAVVEGTSDAVYVKDLRGRYLLFNSAAARFARKRVEEVIGHDDTSLFSRDEARTVMEGDRRAMATGQPTTHEEVVTTADGTRRTFQSTKGAMLDRAGHVTGLFGVARDITERKRAEEELRGASQYARSLIEASLDPLVTISLEGKITDVNQATEVVTGVPRAQLVGSDFSDYFTEPEKARAGYQQVLAQGLVRDYALTICHTSGSTTDVLYSATVYRNERGEIQGVFAAARDITERKRAEEALRKSETQLRQAQKMEAIGQLAGGVAHDFNNLLTVIGSYCEILLNARLLDEEQGRMVEEIRKAGERAADLSRQLLAFSRKQVLQLVVLDLNDVVTDVQKMLGRLLRENIELVVRLCPALRYVKVDPGQVEQVLVNLVVNARDAIPDQGRVDIETDNVDVDETYAWSHPDLRPGPYVVLAVSDTGGGMTEEVKSHLFEPFFTTKGTGRGTGLGLSTVYGVVKQSGGCIYVYSEPGRGTTFKIYLPASAEQPVAAATVQDGADIAGGTEVVLVTEDSAAVRAVISGILRAYGYRVLEACDGQEALRVSSEFGGIIHLLVTDVIMPNLDGPALAAKLSESRAGLKALYVSGYAHDTEMLQRVLENGVAHLQKPFTRAALARRVREVLDQTP